MSVNKFKFVSPGVFVSEIDNSQLPALPRGVGPVVIGRSIKGPSMRPVQINSFAEFVETFGDPIYGGGAADVWRAGPNVSSPSYATYAAQAYLRNQSPLIFVRLAGIQDSQATTKGGKAGWEVSSFGETATAMTSAAKGGAFGLFMGNSGSTGEFTGTLAAIFYARTGSVGLSGTLVDGTLATGTAGLFSSADSDQFTAEVKDETGAVLEKVVFNFDENSKLFIRNVFNTNPALCNNDTKVNPTGASKTYFLGESFERSVTDMSGGIGTAGLTGYATILGLASGSVDQHIQHTPLEDSLTGWFFSQDLGDASSYNALNMQKLFRFQGLGGGEWQQNNLKISITNITPSNNVANPYGYFSVSIRGMSDSDNNPRPVETYSDVNLNPNSPNYIARRIGDSYTEWDSGDKRYVSYGDYVNQSRYIRVEVDASVRDSSGDAKFLPFGVYGPTRWKGFTAISGGTGPAALGVDTGVDSGVAYALGNGDIPDSLASTHFINAGNVPFTASFEFPSVPTRTLSNEGIITDQKNAYFGATSNRVASNRVEASIRDMLRRKPDGTGIFTTIPDSLEYSWIFSLDDLTTGSATNGATAAWVSGSRATGDSFTASGSYQSVLTEGFQQFTTVISEGFEGINILEKEPFRNTAMTGLGAISSYEYATYDRAIDTVSDADVVECNMMTIPGLTNTNLTSKLLDVCEARADALAIVDLPGEYTPPGEDASLSDSARIGTVQNTIDLLDNRNINNSYGCTYYPWVQVTDTVTTGGSLWTPPSVVVLGTLASSQASSELWFAPAGFTRGGLTEGSAGLPVTNVRSRLNSKERDDLYNANINPIAQFPAEGIVIFGQKTLQITQSALDRINVRRLMIYVKREISRISATLLFEQNVNATWNRFLGQVNPFLGSIQTRLGLTDYKVILDQTTTTPDLIDRNILYAKIFLKPARAIEFIALDFVITKTGAGFED
jgi:hypothetical protein